MDIDDRTSFKPLTWTKEKPKELGWYWVVIDGEDQIVWLQRLRAFGDRLCMHTTPVEEIENAYWAGPIPYPNDP